MAVECKPGPDGIANVRFAVRHKTEKAGDWLSIGRLFQDLAALSRLWKMCFATAG